MPGLRRHAPDPDELASKRADPLLWEQELDVRPELAQALERALGFRAGRAHFRSEHDHVYALELADLGRGRPSMARVFGLWDRFEPRPPEHEIDADLLELALWFARATERLDPEDVRRVAAFAGVPRRWPEGAVLRTPDECFARVPDFAWPARFVELEGLRIAYVELGRGDPILLLHGEPSWGYLWRHALEPLARVGRVIAPDLVGFGRSDKPALNQAHSARAQVRWLRKLVEALGLERVTLVGHDAGAMFGLRVVADVPQRFRRVALVNGALPDGRDPGQGFLAWRRAMQRTRDVDVVALLRPAFRRALRDDELAGYAAPFPSPAHQIGLRRLSMLVPTRPDHPGARENRRAAERLRRLDLPVLLPWSDPIAGAEPWRERLREIFPRAALVRFDRAGHFLPEDSGDSLADCLRDWIRRAS
jgi:haloalkane dehalogenase